MLTDLNLRWQLHRFKYVGLLCDFGKVVASSDRPHHPHILKDWFILLFEILKIRNIDHTIGSMVNIPHHRNMYRKFSNVKFVNLISIGLKTTEGWYVYS